MSCKFDKEIARMKRIEGQARGIVRMMEDERYCIDILQQMSAMEAAIRAAKSKVLGIHANCSPSTPLAQNQGCSLRRIWVSS